MSLYIPGFNLTITHVLHGSNTTTEKTETNKETINNQDFLELELGKRKNIRVPLMCPNHKTLIAP
jgi:hypothetical protein